MIIPMEEIETWTPERIFNYLINRQQEILLLRAMIEALKLC